MIYASPELSFELEVHMHMMIWISHTPGPTTSNFQSAEENFAIKERQSHLTVTTATDNNGKYVLKIKFKIVINAFVGLGL